MKKQTDKAKRKLVQVTWQVYEDQKEKLLELGKTSPMQGYVREALDAKGICNEEYFLGYPEGMIS